ncbi:MAG: DUF1579 domain-containing protein [Phycisphaerae bacterium]
MRKQIGIYGMTLLAGALALPLLAQDEGGSSKKAAAPDEAAADMMALYQKFAEPGEFHAHLRPMAGKWRIQGKYRFVPGAPWVESKSAGESKWILGGRFLEMRVKGEPMAGSDLAFEGFGVFGYDNHKKKYTSMWMDNMGTMIMMGEGTCDSSGKVITMVSHFTDPVMNMKTSMRSVYRIINNEKYVLSMYGVGPDGKDFLMMELNYARIG